MSITSGRDCRWILDGGIVRSKFVPRPVILQDPAEMIQKWTGRKGTADGPVLRWRKFSSRTWCDQAPQDEGSVQGKARLRQIKIAGDFCDDRFDSLACVIPLGGFDGDRLDRLVSNGSAERFPLLRRLHPPRHHPLARVQTPRLCGLTACIRQVPGGTRGETWRSWYEVPVGRILWLDGWIGGAPRTMRQV